MKTKFLFLVISLIMVGAWPQASRASYEHDLAFREDSLRLAYGDVIVGKEMRLLAKIYNLGTVDMKGGVAFYFGSQLIGNSQEVSVLSGSSDDVWVTFTVPDQPFNIRAIIITPDVSDQRPDNNQALTPFYNPDIDTDRDGKADAKDTDDDNDGLSDEQELTKGTDPKDADSDNDGKSDLHDFYPLDGSRWQEEVVKPQEVITTTIVDQPVVAVTDEPVSPSVATVDNQETPVTAESATSETVLTSTIGILRPSIFANRRGYKTYSFASDLPGEVVDQYQYFWTFGDGGQSVERIPKHHYRQGGTYEVTLTIEDQNRQTFMTKMTIEVGWFDPGNWQVWLSISLLIIIGAVLLSSLSTSGQEKFKKYFNKS